MNEHPYACTYVINEENFHFNFIKLLLSQFLRENLSSLSVPAKSRSFGTGLDKNFSDRPSYLKYEDLAI